MISFPKRRPLFNDPPPLDISTDEEAVQFLVEHPEVLSKRRWLDNEVFDYGNQSIFNTLTDKQLVQLDRGIQSHTDHEKIHKMIIDTIGEIGRSLPDGITA